MVDLSLQVAQMTSSRAITHLFSPPSTWEWRHSTAPKQVPSLLWTQTDRIWLNPLCQVNSIVMCVSGTDLNSSVEKAWIELEGIEAIVKTASKAKFFIEFYSSCLEGLESPQKDISYKALRCAAANNLFVSFTAETRRSSENDSQSCDVPGFLKLGWSFKQLPKVRSLKWLKLFFVSEVKLLTCFFWHSFFRSCLTWSFFRISTCCCPSSHVMGSSHMVGHSAN